MPHSMVWMNTDEIIQKVPCTCIDGRTPGLRYSVAGGSFGLILLTLSNIEQSLQRALSDEEVGVYLSLFAQEVGPVYLHTDQHAIDLIYARMGIAPDSKLRELTPAQQKSFIHFAVQPDFQGCGHVKLLMQHSTDYDIPQRLVKSALQAFFIGFFARENNIVFDILAGRHAEERVLLLDDQGNTETERQSALYLETPLDENRFFCHRPLKRALIARFLTVIETSGLPSLSALDTAQLAEQHDASAERTLGHLAPHLPIEYISA
ncbi:hypothetical protein ACFOSD_14605 [Salinispirillum marinum]|uniref:N-acetyltransferase domain-containing protein n=2 Tax=Saccharospirillaceae TaxID=255527 RepID=A0ABV8BJ94_9GAMM